MTHDETRLARLLEELADPESEAHKEAVRKTPAAPPDAHEAILVHELSQKVAPVLCTLPQFSSGQPMIRICRGAIGLSADQAAAKLIQHVRATGDGTAAVTALLNVLATQRASGVEIMAAHGFTCSTEISLTDTIRIIPLASLRPSPNLSATTEPPLVRLGPTYLRPPAAALVMNIVIAPVIIHAGSSDKHPTDLEYYQQLTDALHLLALVDSVVPREAASWFEYDDPDLRAMATFGRFARMYELLPPYSGEPVHITADMIGSAVRDFPRLPSSDQARIRIALERIIQSRCWLHPGNQALELGIALEVLLVDKSGEHTHKIGVRCARTITQSKDDRVRVKRLLSGLYEIRSRMVHTGRTGKDVAIKYRGRMPVAAIVQEARAHCCLLIRACLERGAIPNWEEFDLT